MKKAAITVLLLVGMIMLPVKALEHNIGELIPVDETATVDTDIFNYQEISYSKSEDTATINIKAVYNKTDKQKPMSINILLFDKDRVNIGFVAYCTEKDVESNYSQAKVSSNKAKDLSIRISKKYYAEEKTFKDVAFYSVLDANEYCQIGGYDKYSGLTIEEIINGRSEIKENHTFIGGIISIVLPYIPIVAGVVVFVIIISLIAKIIKKSSNEKMVSNKVAPVIEEPKREEIKIEEKKEELVEEDSTNSYTSNNRFVNLDFAQNAEEDKIANDSSLINDYAYSGVENPTQPENEASPVSQETTPSQSSSESNELMDLFK